VIEGGGAGTYEDDEWKLKRDLSERGKVNEGGTWVVKIDLFNLSHLIKSNVCVCVWNDGANYSERWEDEILTIGSKGMIEIKIST